MGTGRRDFFKLLAGVAVLAVTDPLKLVPAVEAAPPVPPAIPTGFRFGPARIIEELPPQSAIIGPPVEISRYGRAIPWTEDPDFWVVDVPDALVNQMRDIVDSIEEEAPC